MSQSMTLSPRALSAPAPFADFRSGPLRVRCLNEFRSIFDGSQLEWLDPRPAAGVELVKRNTQRSVWRVTTGGRELFVKLYRPNGWGSRIKLWFRGPTAELEWNVGHYAASHGLPAVRPVMCGWEDARARTGPSFLVTAAVAGARSLDEYWLSIRNDRAAAQALLDAVARLVARAHQCGFHHRDMHAGNILVHGDTGEPEALFVDLHNVQVGRRVPIASVIANLAQLNQWFRRHASRTQRLAFLKKYLRYRDQFATINRCARNWQVDLRTLLAELDRQAARHAERIWSKRDRRAQRDGRYFCRVRPARGWLGVAVQMCKHGRSGSALTGVTLERRLWQNAIGNPRDLLNGSRATILKDSHTAVVARISLEIGTIVLPAIVKRPLARTLVKRVAHLLGRSRNMRTWRMANKLAHRDLPTAQPLAVVERRRCGFLVADSILLTEAVESFGDLESYLVTRVAAMPAEARRREKDALISSAVRLLKDLHARGFAHRDCKATNILVAPDQRQGEGETGRLPAPQLVLIDLDGITHRPRWRRDPHAIWRAVMRLNVSLMHCPAVTRTDRLRFLKSLLLAPGRSDRDWKLVWRDLADRSQRKQRDKDARRRWKLEHYGRE